MELDNLAAETAAYLTTTHPDYAVLAARIAVSNLHKETKKQFSAVMEDLFQYFNPFTKSHCPLISDEVYEVVTFNSYKTNNTSTFNYSTRLSWKTPTS